MATGTHPPARGLPGLAGSPGLRAGRHPAQSTTQTSLNLPTASLQLTISHKHTAARWLLPLRLFAGRRPGTPAAGRRGGAAPGALGRQGRAGPTADAPHLRGAEPRAGRTRSRRGTPGRGTAGASSVSARRAGTGTGWGEAGIPSAPPAPAARSAPCRPAGLTRPLPQRPLPPRHSAAVPSAAAPRGRTGCATLAQEKRRRPARWRRAPAGRGGAGAPQSRAGPGRRRRGPNSRVVEAAPLAAPTRCRLAQCAGAPPLLATN